jgi:hypothetical protein
VVAGAARELCLQHARQRVTSAMPRDPDEICNIYSGVVGRIINHLCRETGQDLAAQLDQAPAAEFGTARPRLKDSESKRLWSLLPQSTRDFLWRHVGEVREVRRRTSENSSSLDDFLRELFQPGRHLDLLQTLCKDLRYVHEHAEDLLEVVPDTPTAREYDRQDSSHCLDLLARCPEDPTCTKFAYMFRREPRAALYRQAFMLSHGLRGVRGMEIVINRLATMQEQRRQAGANRADNDDLKLWHLGQTVLRERISLAQHNLLDWPEDRCGLADMWPTILAAIAFEDYWVSPLELQCLAACMGCSVRSYKMEWEADLDHRLSYQDPTLRAQDGNLLQDLERALPLKALTVFDAGRGEHSQRGHFSRLLSAAEWRSLRAGQAAPAPAPGLGSSKGGGEGEDGASGKTGSQKKKKKKNKHKKHKADPSPGCNDGSSTTDSSDSSSSSTSHDSCTSSSSTSTSLSSSSGDEGANGQDAKGSVDDAPQDQPGATAGVQKESPGEVAAGPTKATKDYEDQATNVVAWPASSLDGAVEPTLPEIAREDVDMDELSDISDNSDIFHVETLPEDCKPSTMEDEDLAVAQRLKSHLREQPLLPPDPVDASQSAHDVDSGAKYPDLHCAIRGCSWHADFYSSDARSGGQGETYHWTLERKLFEHLISAHGPSCDGGDGIMEEILGLCVEPEDDGEMTALAYYMYAVRERLRDGMPVIGPSVDRRAMAYVHKLSQSRNIKGLACFACAQVHTWVRSWERMYHVGGEGASSEEEEEGEDGNMDDVEQEEGAQRQQQELHTRRLAGCRQSSIQYHRVKNIVPRADGESQCDEAALEEKWKLFLLNLGLDQFRKCFAEGTSSTAERPLAESPELVDGNPEWQCELDAAEGDEGRRRLLCCPEDVRKCQKCLASPNHLQICCRCEIPLCIQCHRYLHKVATRGTKHVIPMGLCNDNFWGYTTDLLTTLDVRWIEAGALVS